MKQCRWAIAERENATSVQVLVTEVYQNVPDAGEVRFAGASAAERDCCLFSRKRLQNTERVVSAA
jgi:hypothetical protein